MQEAYTTPAGRYVEQSSTGETVLAFVPNPLPPGDLPALRNEELDLLERANLALGRLDGLADLLPDASLFIYFYVRKEAVLSAQRRSANSALRIHERLQRRPITQAVAAAESTGLSHPTVQSSLRLLEKMGIVQEVSAKERGRVYAYTEYLEVLNAGT